MDSRPGQGMSHVNIPIRKPDLPDLCKPDPSSKTNTATHPQEALLSEKLCEYFNRSTTRFGLQDLHLYSIRRMAIVKLVASGAPMPLIRRHLVICQATRSKSTISVGARSQGNSKQ